MFGKKWTWAAVALATVLSLVGTVAAFAGAPTGAGPDNALAPSSGWVQLGPGQQHWYAFDSSGAGSSANDAQIIAQLIADPQGSATFSVWTDAAARGMLAGDTTATAIGNGTLQTKSDGSGGTYDLYNNNLLWQGSSRDSGSYFLVVQSTSSSPSRYMLTITGNYLSFPGAAPAAATTSAPATTTASSSAETPPAILPATGQNQAAAQAPQGSFWPDRPLSVNGAQHTIGAGQQQWYAFQYPGPDADGNRPVVTIVMMANPADGATFSVWNADRLASYAAADPNVKALGNGTLHPVSDGSTAGEDRFNGNLAWSGGFGSAGTYYVQVQTTGNAPVSYTLQFSQQ